jgi:hypothetical protein
LGLLWKKKSALKPAAMCVMKTGIFTSFLRDSAVNSISRRFARRQILNQVNSMKTTRLSALAALALLLTINYQLFAAPLGTAFTYQGRLAEGGQPSSGSCDLTFTLCDAASISHLH